MIRVKDVAIPYFIRKENIMASMKGARRVWRDNSEFKGKADAEKVQQEINMLAAKDANGKCKNEVLVDFARRHPASESHKCFEWDDTKAAERYRLSQATRIKCEIITITAPASTTKTPKQTSIEVVTNHSLPTPGEGHKDIQLILSNKTDTAALDQEMYENFRVYVSNFKKRFPFAPSYASIATQLDAIVANLP